MDASNKIVKEYTNGELTIIWKPNKCIHSAICVKKLPKVYNPKEKPWIKMGNVSTEALKDQIMACPSRALTFRMNNKND